ncbi:hypothetical protein FKW77_001503 [Venturia effusa]|uniref:Catalase core domain-containing protein n=1 Tax=Venturia effusa TaxID=50376 RepID=A0A517LKU0_9PEZI|nr:hypothetical protein FKW77_001503 [Venturia effusa]
MAQKVSSLIAAGTANYLSSEQYVKYNDEGVEPIIPNEVQLTNDIINIISRVQTHNFSMHRHVFRGTHVKTQGIVKGTLAVVPGLPTELAQAIASPANAKSYHPVAIRFANEPSFLQDDRVPGPRGAGLKIFNVEGEFLSHIGSLTKTQDLTFNNAPLLELTDLATTVDVFSVREKYFRDPEKIAQEMKTRKDAKLQMAPVGLPNRHFLSYTMYSQSSYRWGPYVVKYALFPTGELQKSLEKQKIEDSSDPEQHSNWLQDFFSKNEATYDLRVQLCQSLSQQPVENCSVAWDETAFPFQTVAKIVLPKQESFSNDRRIFWEDAMKLNVWYGLKDMQPLGSVNRLRKRLYESSAQNRAKGNSTEPMAVGNIEQIP